MSPVCHRGAPVNVFHFGQGDWCFFFLCLRINLNFPVQSSVATFPVLQLLLKCLHLQLCTCEKCGGQEHKASRTVAGKLPHTCGVGDKILVVWMVKVKGDPLFRNQHLDVGLCTAYGHILQVHVRANLLQSTRKMQPLQLPELDLFYLLFPARTVQIPHTIHRVHATVVCQGEDVPPLLKCCKSCNTA